MTDWKERLGMVYSTDKDFEYKVASKSSSESLPVAKQHLRVALDKRNRGGKQVTLVADFVGSDDDLQALGRLLKTKCGVGGSAKDGEIIIQGDHRDRVVALLIDMGYKARKI
ncbi:MAG: translation initiation factor [Mucinivorans sp.]